MPSSESAKREQRADLVDSAERAAARQGEAHSRDDCVPASGREYRARPPHVPP